jgi:hypothetical protein
MDALMEALEYARLQSSLGADAHERVEDIVAMIGGLPEISFAESSTILKALSDSPFNAATRARLARCINVKTVVHVQPMRPTTAPHVEHPSAAPHPPVVRPSAAPSRTPSRSSLVAGGQPPLAASSPPLAAAPLAVDDGNHQLAVASQAARANGGTRADLQENMFVQRCIGL